MNQQQAVSYLKLFIRSNAQHARAPGARAVQRMNIRVGIAIANAILDQLAAGATPVAAMAATADKCTTPLAVRVFSELGDRILLAGE